MPSEIVRRLLRWPRAELTRVWTGGERQQEMGARRRTFPGQQRVLSPSVDTEVDMTVTLQYRWPYE